MSLHALIAEARREYRDSDAAGDVLDWLEERADELEAALAGGGEAAKLTNPYTGEPRDHRDVESDPAGILIVEPGAPLLAAKPADRLPISWYEFWLSQGNIQLANDYATFELANQWLEANIAATHPAGAVQVTDEMVERACDEHD